MGRDSAISARISPGNRRAAVDRRVAAPGFGTLKAHMGEARARRLVVLPLPIGLATGSGASDARCSRFQQDNGLQCVVAPLLQRMEMPAYRRA